MRRSHLQRHYKEQSIRNLFLAIGGIIVIVVLVATFGMDFLIKFSLLLKHSGGSSDNVSTGLSYIAPPVINPIPEATKSATINIDGYAGKDQTVKLYVNGKLIDETQVNKDKKFSFSEVKLEEGSNEIKFKAVTQENKESGFTQTATVSYINKPPTLDVDSPSDGQTVSKGNGLKVSGKTDPGDRVTVNGFWAIVADSGSFSYSLSLHDGDNDIKIIATDDAGNQTTKELKVHTN